MSEDGLRTKPAASFDAHASPDAPAASFRTPSLSERLPACTGEGAPAGARTGVLHFWQRNRFFSRMMFAHRASLDRRILQAIWCLQPEATIGAIAENIYQMGKGKDVRMSEVAATINRLVRASLVRITPVRSSDGAGEVKPLIVPTEMGLRRLGTSAGSGLSRTPVQTTKQSDQSRD
jgi:hypothetical protein